jgi:hypothetical protein
LCATIRMLIVRRPKLDRHVGGTDAYFAFSINSKQPLMLQRQIILLFVYPKGRNTAAYDVTIVVN